MATFRVERTKNYTVMSNHHLKDRGLTLKSKGLLSIPHSTMLRPPSTATTGPRLPTICTIRPIIRDRFSAFALCVESVLPEYEWAGSPHTPHPAQQNAVPHLTFYEWKVNGYLAIVQIGHGFFPAIVQRSFLQRPVEYNVNKNGALALPVLEISHAAFKLPRVKGFTYGFWIAYAA